MYQHEGISHESNDDVPPEDDDILAHHNDAIIDLLMRGNNPDDKDSMEIEWDKDHDWLQNVHRDINVGQCLNNFQEWKGTMVENIENAL